MIPEGGSYRPLTRREKRASRDRVGPPLPPSLQKVESSKASRSRLGPRTPLREFRSLQTGALWSSGKPLSGRHHCWLHTVAPLRRASSAHGAASSSAWSGFRVGGKLDPFIAAPLRCAAPRLHEWHSGPAYSVGPPSGECPRSQGSPGPIRLLQRQQRARPDATKGASRLRSASWCAP
jgi:hypothetical protein